MRDFEAMSDREMVLQKAHQIINVLRTDVNTEDYSVVLLFFYLRSSNSVGQTALNPHQTKQSLLQVLKNANDVTVQRVYDFFLPSIERLGEGTISHVVDLLASIDSQWLQLNIATVYDETLERIALSDGRKSGEFFQPKQLTEFVNAYIGSTKGLKIFNPFAGLASFIKDYNESNSVFAQELNQRSWAIGQLRLIVNKSSANYTCEDSITNWPIQEKFDLIVSNPPFGHQLNRTYRKQLGHLKTAEEFLLEFGLNSLTNSGKLIAILPQGTLFSGGAKLLLRERLINEDLIDTIISFPGGLLYHTGIPFIVLVLNKAKQNPGKIKLIDSSRYVSKRSSRESEIEVEELLQATQLDVDSESARIISNEDAVKNDFNLNIPRYFQEEFAGVKLKEILTYFKGNRDDLPVNGKLVRISDLKEDSFDYQLHASHVKESPLNRPGIHQIDTSCLLLALRSNALKPTYFQFESQPIFNRTDIIISMQVDESRVDLDYLINELNADYVQRQFDGFRLGTTMPRIKREDLLEIKIKLPSIEEQRAMVVWLKRVSQKIERLELERIELVHGLRSKEFNEFASLKHTLGRPRQNILGWSKNLSKFFVREKDTISALNDEFKALFDMGIIEAIDEVNRDIKFISDVLEKGENGLLLNDYEKEIVPLVEINNIINTLSNNEFKFSIKKQLLKVDEMKTRGILINKVLFRTLLDNLLTNADKYGFLNKNKGNHVMIELSEIDDHLIIDVRNNGLPFPKNFDREKFITKYSTADTSNGSGLGGYDINRIATYFENENWELLLNTDLIYPVIFRFSFPIKFLN